MADERSPDAAPISTEFHSTHVESLRTALETLDVSDEQVKVKVEIEASKVHWSELASSYYTGVEDPAMDSSSTSLKKWVHEEGTPEWKLEVAEDNVHVFRSLQQKYPTGFFFDENDVGPTSTQRFPKWMLRDDGTPATLEYGLSSETPFAEGGQAKLFHAYGIDHDCGEKEEVFVMKVFKEGTPLRDLLKLLPTTMLTNDETCIEGVFGDIDYNFNIIASARLLKSTGCFAFLMVRAWGDLRKLIDERMLHFNIQGLPFPNDVAFYILYQTAKGMMELHQRGTIHRDLKAANVLVCGPEVGEVSSYTIDPFNLYPYGIHCMVADFECSIGVVGTRFWRAPEILRAVKNRSISKEPKLFTKQADVYSFGMTCYEVLSGAMPFEQLRANDYDGVICGARPALPSQTPPWMVDLVNRCWHQDPSMRPPFEEIVEILEPYVPKKKRT